MVAASLGAGQVAHAATADFVVKAGAVNPLNPLAPYSYVNFYPSTLQIHRGQSVRWNFAGLHSVLFLPQGAARPSLWRRDEGPSGVALNEAVAFGTCGADSAPACTISSTQATYSSGVGARTFDAVVDLPVGDYAYSCGLHSAMQGTLAVVSDEIALASRSVIAAQTAAQVLADTKNADALVAQASTPRSTLGADGHRTWSVAAGLETDDHRVTVIAYAPAYLPDARAGDRVHFTAASATAIDDPHSVTFPAELVGSGTIAPTPVPNGLAGLAIIPACDPDDPAAGAPGVPYGVVCPANFELWMSPMLSAQHRATNDEMPTPLTYHDSGLLFPAGATASSATDPSTGARFASSFDATFPNTGTFQYACNLHGTSMTGRIQVG